MLLQYLPKFVPFCAPEHCCSELCCLKDKWNLSTFQTKLQINITLFLPPLSISTICVRYLPSHSLLIPYCPKLFHTGFSLSCTSQLSSTQQNGTKHGQRDRAKPGCMSPKQALIYHLPGTWHLMRVSLLHTKADCTFSRLLTFFPVLLPRSLVVFLLQNWINYGFANNN